MKKNLIIVAILCMVLLAIGCANSDADTGQGDAGIELTSDNILDYIHVELNCEQTGTNIANAPVMDYTINIYPIKGGSFNDTELIMGLGVSAPSWNMIKAGCNDIETCTDVNSPYYGITYIKIDLPADGYYSTTFTYSGESAATRVPGNRDDYKFDSSFSEEKIKQFPKIITEDAKSVKGTFIEQ